MSRTPSTVTEQQVKEFVHGYLSCARDNALKPVKHEILLSALTRRWPLENSIALAAHLGAVLVELQKESRVDRIPLGHR